METPVLSLARCLEDKTLVIPSSALAFGLATNLFDVVVQGLYGCISLIILSTQGV